MRLPVAVDLVALIVVFAALREFPRSGRACAAILEFRRAFIFIGRIFGFGALLLGRFLLGRTRFRGSQSLIFQNDFIAKPVRATVNV